jgi:hypothetical protein
MNRPRFDDTLRRQNATKKQSEADASRLNSQPYFPTMAPSTR